MQSSDCDVRILADVLDFDGEDGVTARTLGVHLRGAGGAPLRPLIQQRLGFREGADLFVSTIAIR